MKLMMKTLFMMLIVAALLAACGDDTASDDAVDSNVDSTESELTPDPENEEEMQNNGADDATEEVCATEEDENEENNDSAGFAEDQQLTLGDTGIHDSVTGTFEITLNAVKSEDEVEGDNGFFIFTEVTIKNVSDEAVDVADLTYADLFNDQESGSGPYWDYGFDEDQLEPGESITGELVFDVSESSYYELVYGSAVHSTTNEVRWRFDADEVE
jgi:hypothetical protein